MFYVAYTVAGAAAARPLVFFYNGGPGSATIWLHLGSFAPRRVVTHAPALAVPLPFELVDNAESLIDVADLVFVDAVGTGYSEAVAPYTNQSFWGVDGDAALMRDFIARYVAVNQRAASPTFVLGESYGTTRSAVLADLMLAAGMRLDGVIVLSSVLDYNSNCDLFAPGGLSCEGFLPSYGETGAWHGRVQPARSRRRRVCRRAAVVRDLALRPGRDGVRGDAPAGATRADRSAGRAHRRAGGGVERQPRPRPADLSPRARAGPAARPLRRAHRRGHGQRARRQRRPVFGADRRAVRCRRAAALQAGAGLRRERRLHDALERDLELGLPPRRPAPARHDRRSRRGAGRASPACACSRSPATTTSRRRSARPSSTWPGSARSRPSSRASTRAAT